MHEPATASGAARARQSPIQVLCVASNIVCYGVRAVLNEIFGPVVLSPVESIDAVESAARRTSFDLVLVDFGVPGFDEGAGLQRLVAAMPEVPVVVTSTSEDPILMFAALRAGARGFVPMNASYEVLSHALPLILSGEFYLPAAAFRGVPAMIPPAPMPRPEDVRELPAGAPQPAPLTPRQTEIIAMLALGKSNKEIARDLEIFDGTVKLHIKEIFRKLGAVNRTQAVVAAIRAGYVSRSLFVRPVAG